MPLVEFTVPMEGPRTEAAPRGVSRRSGHREEVPEDEAERLISRGMAHLVDDDGVTIKETNVQNLQRSPNPGNTTLLPPVERAVSVPVREPAAAAGAKRSKDAGAGK